MTKTEKMVELVKEWKTSPLSQKVFCQEKGIKVSTLAYWIAKKKRTEQPSGGFIPIDVSSEPGRQVTITYPNDVRIPMGSADLNLLRRLVGLW